MFAELGAVVIGRNEGDRLIRCLKSVRALVPHVVYVDSGSTDGSLDAARELGAEVVILDTLQAFTAARARNAGWRLLAANAPDVRFVQFIDGDCQLIAGWLETATSVLVDEPLLGVACGRCRELEPQRSIYNRLCDMEWNTPPGDTKSCGGIALMRMDALRQVGGFNEQLIAGEEPELCVRLRAAGWGVRRLNQDMAWHDAAMTRFGQWWRRCRRSGHAFADAVARHGGPPERHGVRPTMSIWLWSFLWPLLTLVLTLTCGPWGLLALVVYPLMVLKIARSRRRSFEDPWSDCLLYGSACVISKWAQLCGQLSFLYHCVRRRDAQLIEYKGQQPSKLQG